MNRWLAGAEVVVAGQQPGLFGGPLLTLVKAATVAAEVRRRRRAGREAVGFFWLATTDDDLPEMGWGRLAVGGQTLEVRIPGERGARMGGSLVLGPECETFLADLEERCAGEFCSVATALAADCYGSGATLADATGSFLAALLAQTGVILVDARLPQLAQAGGSVVTAILKNLPAAWEALSEGAHGFERRGWPVPLRLDRGRLPVFRVEGAVRRRLGSDQGRCPGEVLALLEEDPQQFVPNVWLRPLVQDAALGSDLAILGGAELAYHLQAAPLWPLVGLRRPQWRLRPHVTVFTPGDRQLMSQLHLGPADLLRRQPPRRVVGGSATRKRLDRLRSQLETGLTAAAEAAREELPALQGDLDATARKLSAALEWLERRAERAAAARQDTAIARWHRLQAFLRPDGKPQERRLSVLAPLLRLGLEWPGKLIDALDPEHSGMQLLFQEEGGVW